MHFETSNIDLQKKNIYCNYYRHTKLCALLPQLLAQRSDAAIYHV